MWHGTIVFTGGPPGCGLGFGFAVIVSRAIRSFHRDAAGLRPWFRLRGYSISGDSFVSPGRRRAATSIPLRSISVAGFALSICPEGNASASSRFPFGHIGTAHCQREKDRLRYFI